VEQKEEVEDELESSQATLKRKNIEIQQLRAQNEAMRAELQGEVKHVNPTPVKPTPVNPTPVCAAIAKRVCGK
jgi:hypothetical protein